MCRDTEPEARPLARLARHTHVAAHRCSQSAHNREPQPGTAITPGHRTVGLRKGLEQRLQFVRVDANAGIEHRKLQPLRAGIVCRHPGLDADIAVMGELHCVAYQVAQHLAQARWVAVVGRCRRALPVRGDDQILGSRRFAEQPLDLGQHRLRIEGQILEHHLARLDAGNVENVVQQGQQRLPGRQQRLQTLLAIGLVRIRHQRQLCHAEDAVHRRANLMAHRRQELTLRHTRCLRRLLGADQFALHRFLFGDILEYPDTARLRLGRIDQLAVHAHPHFVAIFMPHQALGGKTGTLHQLWIGLTSEGFVILLGQEEQTRTRVRHAALGIAEHLGHAPVRPDLTTIANQRDADARIVEDRLQLHHSVTQLRVELNQIGSLRPDLAIDRRRSAGHRQQQQLQHADKQHAGNPHHRR